MTPRLCLGTAQFGLTYGVTNALGKVPEEVVSAILLQAKAFGICLLDTAQAYGDAEAVLGRQVPSVHGFRLISKLPAQRQPDFSGQDVKEWEQAFQDTCNRLCVRGLDTLLLHSARDLAKPGSKYLQDWLLGLREKGLVQRLGVSIYSAEDLDGVSPEILDLVQLPLSLFDQRLLADGTVNRLRNCGTAVHARSIYLQGLLLTPSSQWPDWVSPVARSHQQALESLAVQRGCGLIDLALGFAREQAHLEAVVFGVCSVKELIELQQAWSASSPWGCDEWRAWAFPDPVLLDPRCWPH